MSALAKLKLASVAQLEVGNTASLPLMTTQELQQENNRLHRQIKAIITNIRRNEKKSQRFQELELSLINSGSLQEWAHLLLNHYRELFELQAVTIQLIDPSYEMRHMLEQDGVKLDEHPNLQFADHPFEVPAGYPQPEPYLGEYEHEQHKKLFHYLKATPITVALLPLVRKNQLVGSINLASQEHHRFVPGTATDFLERLSNIAAACLTSVGNSHRLRQLGVTDPLTGANNRRFFDQRLNEAISFVRRKQAPLCCLFFDVDHFKQVNDTHGHKAGDKVLKEVAIILRKNLRTSDVLARYGGEEFAALLVETDLQKADEIANRIRENVEAKRFVVDKETTINITISVGVTCINISDAMEADTGSIAEALVNAADERLYEAKHQGRNRVVTGLLELVFAEEESFQLDPPQGYVEQVSDSA
ncbi:MAG: sensor domain-containing diguanylate cyclase [Gammaproteobacteria bacterium]|nr:sensor domain-containing diguanylate cyclase [Gammaproteobacteria bacterium]MDH5731844.1 sensor domain-containing diguanylate cyclase [Gammaproteobacteria bacterium]